MKNSYQLVLETHFAQNVKQHGGRQKYTVTWRPKAGKVKSEQTFIAKQRLGKHIPAAKNKQATIE
jgi:hypothetical protein